MIPREAFHEDLPRHRLGTPDSGGLSSALNGPGRFAGPGDGGWHADHGGRDRAGAPAPALRPGSGEVSPDPTEAGPDDRRAAERGQTVSAFVTAAVQARIAAITPEEIAARVGTDRAKLPPDEEQARKEARSALVRERAGRALQELVERLSREAQVTVSLRAPEPPVMTISVGNGPAWGLLAAPVTLVEFADFECPVCKDSLPILLAVRSLYSEQVRIVYRNFPLASHPQARPAAEAAHCAHEQGQFWAYHDALFAKAPDLQASDYVRLAARLKLNAADFAACLSSDRPKVAVAKDLADAQALGLSGTPTFFINGRYLSGYQTLDTLKQYIDRVLQAARNSAPPGDTAAGAGAR